MSLKGTRLLQAVLGCAVLAALPLQSQSQSGAVRKGNVQINIRSSGRILAQQTAQSRVNGMRVSAPSLQLSPAQIPETPIPHSNTLVNDPNQDSIQKFPGTRPFLHSTQSETVIVKAKGNLIAAFNNSAGIIEAPNPSGPGLAYAQLLIGAYSVSRDNGESWKSAFFPPVPGTIFTFGDPALAVAPDGTVYFSQLGADAAGNSTVQVNRSDDGGLTWTPASVVAVDPGADKEWIATGPDGSIYVTPVLSQILRMHPSR